MMADKMQKNTGAAMGKVGTQSDRDAEDEVSRVSQSDKQQPDEAAVWKDKYVRLCADLENTKKRLARSSTQEVEAEKEALLRDVCCRWPMAWIWPYHAYIQQEDDNRRHPTGNRVGSEHYKQVLYQI